MAAEKNIENEVLQIQRAWEWMFCGEEGVVTDQSNRR